MSFLNQYTHFFEWLGLLSLLTFVGSLIAVPWIISKMPTDYFTQHRRRVEKRHEQHPVAALITFILRNFIGFSLFMAGVAMLVLPRQGIITILIGILIMDFPRKHKVVDYLVCRPKVIQLLNWIRKKEKKPPFDFVSKGGA